MRAILNYIYSRGKLADIKIQFITGAVKLNIYALTKHVIDRCCGWGRLVAGIYS